MSKSIKKPSAVTVTASAEVLAAKVFEAVKTGLDFEATKDKLASLVGQIANQYDWLKAHGVVFDANGKSKCPHRQTVKESVAVYRRESAFNAFMKAKDLKPNDTAWNDFMRALEGREPAEAKSTAYIGGLEYARWAASGFPTIKPEQVKAREYSDTMRAESVQQGKIVSAFIVCYKEGLAYSINPSQAKKREQAKKAPKQPGNKAPANGTTAPQEGANTDPTKTTDNPHGLSVEQLEAFKAFNMLDAALRKLNQYTACEVLRDTMHELAWFPKLKAGQAK